MPAPQKPTTLDSRAVALLEWMGAQPWACRIVLGGAFALKHYLDYRDTHDCDAWWVSPPPPKEEREQILAEVETALRRLNPSEEVRRREWGETDSLEVRTGSRKIFSFQISRRTLQLAAYLVSDWGAVRIESLEDNAASKMCALVERGAPRDFLDIRHLVKDLGCTKEELWALWQRKNAGQQGDEARVLVRNYLEAIAARRPLERLPDSERSSARELREWFFNDFLTDDPGH